MGVLDSLTGNQGTDKKISDAYDKISGVVKGAAQQFIPEKRDPPVAVITTLGKDRLAEFGIPDSEWQILNELSERPLGKSDLARALRKDPKKVGSVLEKLERDGYIVRRAGGGSDG